MPRGGHENKAKRRERATRGKERERERKKDCILYGVTAQHRGERKGARGWRRVNSGEILLVSVKDGPRSALVSWRRRGFSRASSVPNGGGGK